ncbi:MBL fold metallo-hydrolase [Streptomyces sp. VNUA24]|uniref:MBL fold metallo-hydrolase n=1 Tax=Streptomyces sp. VNUA24 TaxID=3031131 RepID=UPI0023B845C4|nr:MBL fold metallo-hydrolase [Streptomyces sp. VNUA24]WEH13093.1 MBL fold metallo-hydrolase [Streptomyces sp. VNUA24]
MNDTPSAACGHEHVNATPFGAFPAPLVDTSGREEIARGVFVVPDRGMLLVPNVGIIVGQHSALVVDTGLGRANGERVLSAAREVAGDRRLYLTATHFHAEHGMGAQAFAGKATIICNRSQRDELLAEGERHLGSIRALGGDFADLLADVETVLPHLVYDTELDLDLGGRVVQLRHFGPGHTAGDQIVFLPGERIMFAGDLLENRQHPVLESGSAGNGSAKWLDLLGALERLDPSIVIPGHGNVTDVSLISDYRTYLTDLRDGVQAAQEAGTSLEEYLPVLMDSMAAERPDWANSGFSALTIDAVHTELADGPGKRWATGLEVISRELGLPVGRVFATLREHVGELVARQVVRSTGDAWSDGVLTHRDRSLISIAALAAAGTAPDGLRPHIRLAVANGTTQEELEGMASLLAVYSGAPVGAVAARTIRQEISTPTSVI